MVRYKQKPIIVEAFYLTEENFNKPSMWPRWMQLAYENNDFKSGPRIWHAHDESIMYIYNEHMNTNSYMAEPGDWIVRGVFGEIYVLSNDEFVSRFEPIP